MKTIVATVQVTKGATKDLAHGTVKAVNPQPVFFQDFARNRLMPIDYFKNFPQLDDSKEPERGEGAVVETLKP